MPPSPCEPPLRFYSQVCKAEDDAAREAAALGSLHAALEHAVRGALEFTSIQCLVLAVFTLHTCRGRGSAEQVGAGGSGLVATVGAGFIEGNNGLVVLRCALPGAGAMRAKRRVVLAPAVCAWQVRWRREQTATLEARFSGLAGSAGKWGKTKWVDPRLESYEKDRCG